eukprot:TRINITY_DN19507_c0_g2_i2.p2 TRINITY_DN19507_c0_g2~~TRINITY_DN19507_c0_g2_i2.p2  ORF type:complete len:107 (-),score=14.67 TRINITY_DN19507_c0_g2_i2:277-597(-)
MKKLRDCVKSLNEDSQYTGCPKKEVPEERPTVVTLIWPEWREEWANANHSGYDYHFMSEEDFLNETYYWLYMIEHSHSPIEYDHYVTLYKDFFENWQHYHQEVTVH